MEGEETFSSWYMYLKNQTETTSPEIVLYPEVKLVGYTYFLKPDNLEWTTDTEVDGEQLIEFAGRMCYQSWSNPAGRTNEQYIRNMLDHGHLSVIEHATASFSITGVSRSCTHELVRHRHFSYSQVSQRYVSEENSRMIEPACIANDPEAHKLFIESVTNAQESYRQIYELLAEKFVDVADKTLKRKLARQAARSVLPNATETMIVMTGNFRAWRHFIRMRANEHADVEIRAVAVEICRNLKELSPAVFGDYQLETLPDGSRVIHTAFTFE